MPKQIPGSIQESIIADIINGKSVKDMVQKHGLSSSYIYTLLKRAGYEIMAPTPTINEDLINSHRIKKQEFIELAKTKLPHNLGYCKYITEHVCPNLALYEKIKSLSTPDKNSDMVFKAVMQYLKSLPPLEVAINNIRKNQKMLLDIKRYQPIRFGSIASLPGLSFFKLERFIEKPINKMTTRTFEINEIIEKVIKETSDLQYSTA